MDERRRQRAPRAARERPHARNQLGEVERLREVVVGADPEPLHAVLDRAGGGQHQHPGRLAGRHQRTAYVVAVEERQIAIEHDHVVGDDVRAEQRVLAVVGDVDGHALAAQNGRDRRCQSRMILDHEHPHEPLRRIRIAIVEHGRSGITPM